MPVIKVENLTHVYSRGTPFEVTSLDSVSLEIQRGEFYALVGATGSGKSTLVQHFNGILAPTGGNVRVCGIDVANKGLRRELWHRVGLVFQQPEHQLFEETVFDDVAFGPRNLGLNNAEVRERVIDALRLVDLDPEEVGRTSPFRLSGGMRRKAAIAGVLALRPEVLVLDEPAAGLDPVSRRQLMERIDRLRGERGITVVLVTHNMEEVARWADRVAVLHKGRLAMEAPPREVFNKTEELRALGLDVPATVELMLRLQARGLPVRADLLTIDEAVVEIARILNMERNMEMRQPGV
ncbi:energy-coupling factor transporter ATPase [Pelotomaculum terephthalicicum JT]|uniref:energy-coupling factor transporter ATPase n=1 Tax=Pelotomaculum TaxID=191373 RepID=UPI0009C78588|nr:MULTISPECIES: energy-coupling factor transporter ATPase [Pelotomaculum]MCG9967879.1 energy-coupling factor transporter ATPase [Pelotomaculum terephthalicicum JT]OPX90991.1 MAG: Energy-coupling factor transporter ATP-binding protein EcfA2 [Pelotomaculum sp. PtaB.Bin117]